ncbi:MAG: hypothetical protein A2V52_08375 [Actinobacteria bacterium RBG_19FT_COMBO_54_7]|nr:MAG: hypothetical protein A2V52_08375 [Actinobacteria bacterium RBG_19FT_COMBO_54_7]
MVDAAVKASVCESLPAPRVRAALPNDDGDYQLFDVTASSFPDFADQLTELLSECLAARGIEPPTLALREIVNNFAHAVPCAGSVVLDTSFKNIYVSDTGPGISSVEMALMPGYSTATALQRSYIRGVGLGLHLAGEELRSRGGDLHVHSIHGEGTHVRLSLSNGSGAAESSSSVASFCLNERQNNVLFLLSEGQSLGPSDVAAELNIGISTAHRELVKLQESGLIYMAKNGKRGLSDVGRSYLRSLLSL